MTTFGQVEGKAREGGEWLVELYDFRKVSTGISDDDHANVIREGPNELVSPSA